MFHLQHAYVVWNILRQLES